MEINPGELPDESGLRLKSLQKRLGFALAAIGISLQLLPIIKVDFAAVSFAGWALSFLGSLLCAKTLIGDFGWCLLALMPVLGAPLAIAGICAQYRWFSTSPTDSGAKRYFAPRDFIVILIGVAILFGGCTIFGVNHVWIKAPNHGHAR